MLKSRFNLKTDDEKEEVEAETKDEGKAVDEKNKDQTFDERTIAESLHLEQLGEALVEEEHIEIVPTYPERKLNRSEISVRLSFLGKTAEGDGYAPISLLINLNKNKCKYLLK